MPVKTSLGESERRAWLRLARTPNVGPVTFKALLERFGSAEFALANIPRLIGRGGGEPVRAPSIADVDRELEALMRAGGRMIASCEPEFPRGLAALDAPPPVIETLGHGSLLSRDAVAIVGARNASALGRKFAERMARDLSDAGLLVVSGLARGIDAAAHDGSLAGGTAAVLAGGVDVVYPPEHEALYKAIAAQGVVVSEVPFGTAPLARHFPRRNRIMSGIARGVVIVEAAEGSGSLITANYALEQGREIFAVPGSPLDPRAKGTNRLIREGATLTESVDDVLAVLKPILGNGFGDPEAGGSPQAPADANALEAEADRIRSRVEEALGPAPVEVDDLIRQIGAPAAVILTVLLELELAGRLARDAGNRVGWV
jgi:DNA processing protein